MVPGGPALTPAAWRGAGATSCKSALNGHFRLRASPRRVFTRLNCSRIMRGLGEARGKFGSGKKKKKIQQQQNPPKHASSSRAASLRAVGFSLCPESKGFRCKGALFKSSGDGKGSGCRERSAGQGDKAMPAPSARGWNVPLRGCCRVRDGRRLGGASGKTSERGNSDFPAPVRPNPAVTAPAARIRRGPGAPRVPGPWWQSSSSPISNRPIRASSPPRDSKQPIRLSVRPSVPRQPGPLGSEAESFLQPLPRAPRAPE